LAEAQEGSLPKIIITAYNTSPIPEGGLLYALISEIALLSKSARAASAASKAG
jgi:hypothetical protein